MSTKIERTAWNLTKMAAFGVKHEGVHFDITPLYEIAKDLKIAMIDGRQYGIDQYVFIPQDVWNETMKIHVSIKDNYKADYKGLPYSNVHHWHRVAMNHVF